MPATEKIKDTAPASEQPPSSPTWKMSVLESVRGIFWGRQSSNDSEADAVSGWVGRKGRGRCRSVGEVH
ncbi:hypothetical protein N7468_003557 [Penicillium chermesinum]|uniref:Uncharacterized protein n=1 Tax=Penicillium chermesinum TaxID=63820 RepID=A0A9W9P6R3_9EURO|nr:uncharacterized protein N7468_003557 [Penicillium chermesinum]KAJ5238938.1 hypothetical protein N7468_003557 [Penicillium chermesinum]KAJ6164580.1 hypothetical protein N7470_003252 [Penicillium chermesinum]